MKNQKPTIIIILMVCKTCIKVDNILISNSSQKTSRFLKQILPWKFWYKNMLIMFRISFERYNIFGNMNLK